MEEEEKRAPTPEEKMQEFIDLMEGISEPHVAHSHKADVFTDLFGEPPYSYELVQTLHPEEEDLKEEDVTVITLHHTLMNIQYNDLGVLVGKRLMILVEAQSTWSVNILLRLFMYIAESVKNYIIANKLDMYGTKKLEIPKPECYVVYTGTRKVPPVLNLSEIFFNGEDVGIDVTAKVITETGTNDILDQYCQFCRIVDEQVRKEGKSATSVRKAIDYCIVHDILTEYLTRKGVEEVVNIMITLFNNQTIMENHDASVKAEGRAEGALATLITLVKEGILSKDEGARHAKMTVSEFEKAMAAASAVA